MSGNVRNVIHDVWFYLPLNNQKKAICVDCVCIVDSRQVCYCYC